MPPTTRTLILGLASVAALLATTAPGAHAASSKGCVGGGFTLTSPAGESGPLQVSGRYVEFTVDPSTLAVSDYTFTGAPNELDMTGGRRTPAFAAKTPDLRGATLTGPLSVESAEEDLVLMRAGTGVSMKIQAKDCAQGGIFQMEPERTDGTPTIVTHRLAAGAFYFDNPFFRERVGQVLNGVTVATRVNIGNDVSPGFVGRDSAQVAEKLSQTGTTTTWSVASGGRLGGVFGEDSVEVAPGATDCVTDCQAQNQVRGQFVVLGFPFPVPAASRLVGAPAAPAAPRAVTTAAATATAAAATPATRGASTARRAVRRLALRLRAGTRSVRISVLRVRRGRAAGRAVAGTTRTVRRGTRVFRFQLDGSALLRRLTAGTYELRLTAGRGRTARLRFTA